MLNRPLFIFTGDKMTDLFFKIPAEVVFGSDSLLRITEILDQPVQRVLVITETVIYEKQTIEQLKSILDDKLINYIIFDEVTPNATSTCAEDALRLAKASRATTIIGLGGMRTLSIAKFIAMAALGSYPVDDYLSGAIPVTKPLDFIGIPTTCRDHFAFTDQYLLTDARNRTGRILKTQGGITKLVVIDPHLGFTLPAKYTMTTILDSLLASIEGYISTKSSYISDMFFCRSIELLQKLVPDSSRNLDDFLSREEASKGGLLACMGLASGTPGIGIGLSYAIGSKLMVPKSVVASIFLPHVVEYNINASSEKLGHVARLLGEQTDGVEPEEAAKRATDACRRLLALAGVPVRLRDLDLKLEDVLQATDTLTSYDLLSSVPRRPSSNELFDIVKAAY
jgi:alcohol dehydrogenase class IV